jgi:hypothetical protein
VLVEHDVLTDVIAYICHICAAQYSERTPHLALIQFPIHQPASDAVDQLRPRHSVYSMMSYALNVAYSPRFVSSFQLEAWLGQGAVVREHGHMTLTCNLGASPREEILPLAYHKRSMRASRMPINLQRSDLPTLSPIFDSAAPCCPLPLSRSRPFWVLSTPSRTRTRPSVRRTQNVFARRTRSRSPP